MRTQDVANERAWVRNIQVACELLHQPFGDGREDAEKTLSGVNVMLKASSARGSTKRHVILRSGLSLNAGDH